MLKKKFLASTILTTSVFALGLGLSTPASAEFLECSGTTADGTWDISDNVTPTLDCTILAPLQGPTRGQANDSLSLVNAEQFFAFSDWLFDGKWESPAENETEWTDRSSLFNFDYIGNSTDAGQGGTFTLAATLDTAITDIMFIFKDGDDTNLVGYLIDIDAMEDDAVLGEYTSPFVSPPFPTNNSATHNVSHISVYYRQGDNTTPPTGGVPEPGPLSLLGLGLMGLWFARRKTSA